MGKPPLSLYCRQAPHCVEGLPDFRMGTKRKGRAAKRRTSIRMREDAVPPITSQLERRAIVDSDNASLSGDSAVDDYVSNVYGGGGSSAEGREMLPLEELFPSLRNVSVGPDLSNGLLASSSEDEFSDDASDGSEEDLECAATWYEIDSFVLLPESQASVVREVSHALNQLASVAGESMTDFATGESNAVPVRSLRCLLAMWDLAERLSLQVSLRFAGGGFENPEVTCARSEVISDEAIDVPKHIAEVVTAFTRNRRPSTSCFLDSEEQRLRSNIDSFVDFVFRCAPTDTITFSGISSSTAAMTIALANIFACRTEKPSSGDSGLIGGLVVYGSSLGYWPKRVAANLAEVFIRRSWDDAGDVNATVLLANHSLLPPRVGSAESAARAVAGTILTDWKNSGSSPDKGKDQFHTAPSEQWRGILQRAFSESFGIACEAWRDDYYRGLAVKVSFSRHATPGNAEVKALTAHVDRTIAQGVADMRAERHAAQLKKLASQKVLDASARSAAAETFPLPRDALRPRVRSTREKSNSKGNTHLREDYLAHARELTTWLEQAPEAGDKLTLQPCRHGLSDALCKLGAALGVQSSKVKQGGVWVSVFYGPLRAPLRRSRVEVEGLALGLFDGGGKGKKKKSKVKTGRAAAASAQQSKAAAAVEQQQRLLRAAPLDATNRGYQILVGAMGHQVGAGLGVNEDGPVAPVLPAFNHGRRGIGS